MLVLYSSWHLFQLCWSTKYYWLQEIVQGFLLMFNLSNLMKTICAYFESRLILFIKVSSISFLSIRKEKENTICVHRSLSTYINDNTQWHVFFHFVEFLYVNYCKFSFCNEAWHIFVLLLCSHNYAQSQKHWSRLNDVHSRNVKHINIW